MSARSTVPAEVSGVLEPSNPNMHVKCLVIQLHGENKSNCSCEKVME